MSKKALGKGLDALLSPKPEKIRKQDDIGEDFGNDNEVVNEGVQFIEIKNVIANPDKPTKEFTKKSLREL